MNVTEIPVFKCEWSEPTPSQEAMEEALSKMNGVLGEDGDEPDEPGSLIYDLRASSYHAIKAFRHLFDALICAQAGIYRGAPTAKGEMLPLIRGGVELNAKW